MVVFLPDELATHHYFFILAVIVLIALYLNDLCAERKCICSNNLDNAMNVYSYDQCDGPPCWKKKFADAGGIKQSPVNLLDSMAKEISSDSVCPLIFSEDFHLTPVEMRVHNNCHNVVVYALWNCNERPFMTGGPLEEEYKFVNMRFRWGPNDHEGSEHMINSTCYSMELQAAFVKCSAQEEDLVIAARNGSLMMLSYLFMVTPIDNPYLEPIISALKYIRQPWSYLNIEPIALSLLMPVFCRDYYTYTGSLSFPPCTEGVLWIVKPEPLMISSKQISHFRRLRGCYGKIENNTRPVQMLNCREISYYE